MTSELDRKTTIRISKALSYLLRHGAEKEELKMRSDGYAKLDDVMKNPVISSYNPSFNTIKMVVDNNDKKRFQMVEEKGIWYIRATQGHSIQLKDMNYKKIVKRDDIPLAVHGTFYKHWGLIKKEGLKKMGRTHIHFSIGEPKSEEVISGMRGNSQLMIYLDIDRCLKDGIGLFISENNVVLTEGINGILPPKYFQKVVDIKTGKNINF